MRYLMFMDDLRSAAPFIVLSTLFLLAVAMIYAPKMSRSWKKTTVRVFGSTLLGVLMSVCFIIALVSGGDPPTQRFGFTSATGTRSALLTHGEIRDGAWSKVTIASRNCCRKYLVYEYYGDGSDYVDSDSVHWVDDHHVTISYARDLSGRQQCVSEADDVLIICTPHDPLTFSH